MKRIIIGIFLMLYVGMLSLSAQQYVPIYADTDKNDTIKKLVNIITEELSKSQRVKIEVKETRSFDGKGIYLGNRQFAYTKKVVLSSQLPGLGCEAFTIVADGQSVQIVGNSDMAVGHGMFTWLESIGYRYYFAHPDWYIVPQKPDLYKKLNVLSKPSLNHRKIFYGYGTGSPKADKDFAFWQLANKMGGSLNAIFGHSYDNIILRHKKEFEAHPEWFYPKPAKGTIPIEPKFDMSNEELVQIVIKDVIWQIETSLKNKTEAYKMITLGPSDGVGTCNSPACQKLGTMSDRVFYLVNRVAKAIQKKYPDTKIGCLAYSEYIAPVTGKVEPNVYVGITTAFNNSKYSTDQLVNEWSKKGGMVGIYDYFSWYAWDYDIPGQSQASTPSRIIASVRKYHKLGVSGFDGESSIGWVSKGLGYLAAAKTMWDVKTDFAPTHKEFFEKCFGRASATVKKIWDDWETYGFTQVRENDLAQWIDLIYEAEKQEPNEDVQKRLYHIKSYLYYLHLYRQYQLVKTEANLLTLLTYGFRMLEYGSVSGYPAFFELGNRSGIPGMAWGADAKWRTNKGPLTTNEMNSVLTQARGGMKMTAPVQKFASAAKFKNIPSLSSFNKSLYSDSAGLDNAFWLVDEWVLQIKNKGASNYIEFTGDFIADKSNPQPIRINIYPYAANGEVAGVEPLVTYTYTATKVKEIIKLDQLSPGYYTMIIEDPVKVYRIKFSPPVNHSVVMRPTRQLKTTSLNYAFIYVPEGVTKFNVIKSRIVKFVTPTGRAVNLTNDKEEDIQVDVQKGEAGLWRVRLLADRLYLEGIPPYLSTSARQMLIPDGTK